MKIMNLWLWMLRLMFLMMVWLLKFFCRLWILRLVMVEYFCG